MNMKFSDNTKAILANIIPEELGENLSNALHFPRIFCNSELFDAWSAILGEPHVKRVADRLAKLRLNLPIPKKQIKDIPPEFFLSICYSMNDFRDQVLKSGGQRQYDDLNICKQTEHLLDSLLPSELVEKMKDSSDWHMTQAIEEIKTSFPLALPLVTMGLSSKHYRNLLAIPHLVAMLAQSQGDQLARATMAIHVILVEKPIYGLAFKTLNQWPELFKDFSYTIRAAKIRAIGIQNYNDPTCSITAKALKDNLLKLSATLAPDTPNLESPFKALLTIFQIAIHTTSNHYALAYEHLYEIYIFRILNMYDYLQKNAALAGCEMPEIRQDLAELELGSITPPKSYLPSLHDLCRNFFTKATFDEKISNWDIKKTKFDNLAATVNYQRTLLHQLTATGSSVNINKLTAAANQMAEQTGDLKLVWGEMYSIVLDMHEEYHDFVTCWNSNCENHTPDAVKADDGTGDHDDLEERIALLMRERDDARQEVHRLRSRIDVLTNSSQNLAVPTLEFPVDLVRKIIRDPGRCSPRETLEYIQAMASSRVVILPSAWQSADESERFELTPRLLQLLDTLVFDYAPALAGGIPDAQARDLLGGAYAAKESDTTRNDTEMARERTFDYAGQSHLFERHLKIGKGSGANRGMRVYFEIIDGKVVIAYCGRHLTVASSN